MNKIKKASVKDESVIISNNPKISVLMSCYNTEKYVWKTIESVLSQSFLDFEFIILDDGSTDGTLSVISKYAYIDSRIKIINKEHTGMTKSLNVGLFQAKGEWIARVDSDDFVLKQRLENQLKYVVAKKGLVCIGGWFIEIDDNGKEICRYKFPESHNKLMSRLNRGKTPFAHVSSFFNKECALQIGGYNEMFYYSQDIDLWLRFSEIGKIGCYQGFVEKTIVRANSIRFGEDQHLQKLYAVCAYICHLFRINNYKDPSNISINNVNDWKLFYTWINDAFLAEDFYKVRQLITNLKYKVNSQNNLLKKLNLITNEVLNNFILFRKFVLSKISYKRKLKKLSLRYINWRRSNPKNKGM